MRKTADMNDQLSPEELANRLGCSKCMRTRQSGVAWVLRLCWDCQGEYLRAKDPAKLVHQYLPPQMTTPPQSPLKALGWEQTQVFMLKYLQEHRAPYLLVRWSDADDKFAVCVPDWLHHLLGLGTLFRKRFPSKSKPWAKWPEVIKRACTDEVSKGALLTVMALNSDPDNLFGWVRSYWEEARDGQTT